MMYLKVALLYSRKSKKSFKALFLYEILYIDKTEKFRELWKEKDIEILFEEKKNPFITNILLLLGLEYHKENIKKYNLFVTKAEIGGINKIERK